MERTEKQIILPNDVAEVPRLASFVDEVCEDAGLGMGAAMQVNLAVEEAVVNVMNYAYPKGTKGTVEIAAVVDDCSLVFVVTDSGTPFDPTAKGEADTTLNAEERPIGGLGIHLVRQIMDGLEYERTTDGRNVLTMRKNLSH